MRHGALALLIVESLNEGEDNVYLIYVAALIEKSEEAVERKKQKWYWNLGSSVPV